MRDRGIQGLTAYPTITAYHSLRTTPAFGMCALDNDDRQIVSRSAERPRCLVEWKLWPYDNPPLIGHATISFSMLSREAMVARRARPLALEAAGLPQATSGAAEAERRLSELKAVLETTRALPTEQYARNQAAKKAKEAAE